MVTDLEKATELGYKILKFHELHHYEQRDFILRDFVSVLAKQKLQFSGIPSDVPENQRDSFCDELNKNMNFEGDLLLNAKKITNNESQKTMYKSMMNNFLGRFALNSNFSSYKFVRSAYEIEQELKKSHTCLVDIFDISETFCQLEISNNSNPKPNQCGSLYITSEVNSLARRFTYSKSEQIEKIGGIILAIDTDAIIYALPKGVNDVIKYGPEFGAFKNVLGNDEKIEQFMSLGPRNFMLVHRDKNGTLKTTSKIKGLCLTSANNCNEIDAKTYSDFILKRFHNEYQSKYIPQMRMKIDKQTKTFHDMLTKFNFSNDLHVKRFCVSDSADQSTIKTYPYGYKFAKNEN